MLFFSSVVIDMLSLERNYILVKTWQVGGPSERALPPRIIPTKVSIKYHQLLIFNPYPADHDYCCF